MLGRGLLFVAIGFAAYAGIAAPASTRRGVVTRPELLTSARRALVACAIAVAGAAGLLWYAFFTRDFSIAYVAANTSRSAAPWYTFSALWAGMSGSLVLWCLVLSIYSAAFASTRRGDTKAFVPWAIPVLSGGLLFFLLMTAGPENPFARLDVTPVDGRGLNPLLHSPGMVIHPPMLYTGLVGMIVPFAVAISAMVTKRTGAEWLRVVRRWTLIPWLALGIGLVLGGAWAYTELGWGGYWGWDPVENAALMPWLCATAFIHSSMVTERRNMLRVWNVFLVCTAGILATFGTFLTRSGLLSSVHTFSESPIGRWFFVFLGLQLLVGFGLIVYRLPSLRTPNRLDAPVSKESAFLVNNLLFCGAVVVVLWGTLLPIISDKLWGKQIAVGPPFFNRVMTPLGAALLLLASGGTAVPWRRGTLRAVGRRLALPAVIALAIAGDALLSTRRPTFAGMVFIAALLGATSVVEIVRAGRARARATGVRSVVGTRDVVARNPRRYGGYIVHLGVAVMVIGMAGSIGRAQTEVVAKPGDHFGFAGYVFEYKKLERFEAPDKNVNLAVLDVRQNGKHVATMRPQLNLHVNWDQPQSEIAIRTTPLRDLYVILAGTSGDSDESVFRIHSNPLVLWVWLGAVIAVFGGLIAIFGGRKRAPAPAATPPARTQEAAWTR